MEGQPYSLPLILLPGDDLPAVRLGQLHALLLRLGTQTRDKATTYNRRRE